MQCNLHRAVEEAGVAISRDGQGRVLDKKRLCRTVKYEASYVQGYPTVPEVEVGLKVYF